MDILNCMKRLAVAALLLGMSLVFMVAHADSYWQLHESISLPQGAATKIATWYTAGFVHGKLPKLVLTNTQAHCIQIFDPDIDETYTIAGTCGTPGESLDTSSATDTLLKLPLAAIPISADSLLIADTGNKRLLLASPSGVLDVSPSNLVQPEFSDLCCPTSSCQHIYATDMATARIYAIDPTQRTATPVAGTGKHRFSEQSASAMDTPLAKPVSLACTTIDPDKERIFVADADARIVRMLSIEDGRFTITAGDPFSNPLHTSNQPGTPAAFAQFARPFRVSILPRMEGLLITDPPAALIFQYSIWDGNTYFFEPPQANHARAYHVQFTPDGTFYAVSFDNGTVQIYKNTKQRK